MLQGNMNWGTKHIDKTPENAKWLRAEHSEKWEPVQWKLRFSRPLEEAEEETEEQNNNRQDRKADHWNYVHHNDWFRPCKGHLRKPKTPEEPRWTTDVAEKKTMPKWRSEKKEREEEKHVQIC